MTPKGRKSIDWQDMQNRIIGLGEGSLHKSHYPELQARLRELERFRSLLDLSSDMIFTIDIDGGRIVDWNLAARCALGYDAPPSLADIDAAAAVAFLDRAKRADAATEGETDLRRTLICDFRRADGSRFPVELAISLETAPSDRYAIAVGRDISERIAAERQLRLAASVFDNSIEAVMVLFPDGAISAVNPAFAQITGHTAAEVIGKPVDLLRSPRHGAEFYRTLWAAVLDTGLWQGEIWSQRKNGETFPMWMAISAVRDDDGHPVQYICVFSDISRIKESERRLEHLTHHDPLTELPNRLFLGSAVEHALTRSKRDGQSFALLFIDIDRFKTINDTLGHETGDRLLRAAADRIVAAVRAVDLVAHLSGDEFVVMVEDIAAPEDAARVARKILRAFATPFDLDGFEAFISLSIGISLYPNHGANSSALFRNGDSAMYGAKAEGGNRFQIYTQELTRIAFQNLEIETSLRRAIDGGELELYYQPQYRLADDSLYGVEALVRWQHPKRGTIPPDAFIPRAEETGLIVPMGARLLLDACRRARSWMDRGLSAVPVAVNISGVQISDSPIVDTVAEALATSGLPPGLLKLEITESFAMRGTSGSIDCLHALRGLGVELAIDDFGTGYASLSYLRELPINVIKIDREFVRNLPDHRGDCAIVEAIVAMAHGLGLLVVAEGVETEEQKAFLKAAGCDVSQGYLGGRPMPAADFETRLRPAPTRR